jgi:hypothetical protein
MDDAARVDAEMAFDTLEDAVAHVENETAIDIELARERDEQEPVDLFGAAEMTGRPELDDTMIPRAIWAYAEDTSRRIGLNPASVAIPCLAVLATAIREGWRVQPKLNDWSWTESPNLWVALTGSTGAAKTAALASATAPLSAIEKEWMEQDRESLRQYNLEYRIYKKKLGIFEDAAAKGDATIDDAPEEPEKPLARRLVVHDTTVEGIMPIAAENADGLLIELDELASFIGSFDAYNAGSSKGASKDKATWLKAYNGMSHTIDRVSKQIHVRRLAINIAGGVQDDKLRDMFKGQPRDGFISRFLFATAEPRLGTDEAPNRQAYDDYTNIVRRLAELHAEPFFPQFDPQTQQQIVREWGLVHLSEGAAEIREQLYRLRHDMQSIPTLPQGLRDNLAKWDGMFARVCLVYHMVDCVSRGIRPDNERVSRETADMVRRLFIRFVLPEQMRVYSQVLEADDAMADPMWVAGHILAHGLTDISANQIGRAYRKLRGDKRAIRRTMDTLELLGWVKPAGRGKRGVNPSDVAKWDVNPLVHTMFATRAEKEAAERRDTVAKIRESAGKLRELTETAGAE